MKNKWVFLSLVCVVVISSSVFGGIANTSQTWTFSTNANPATADQPDGNIFGDATAVISFTGTDPIGAFGWCPGLLGRTGVWAGDTVTAVLTIPNSPETNPYKEIWVEAGCRGHLLGETYEGDNLDGTGVSLGLGYSVLNPQSVVQDLGYTITNSGGWETLVFGIRIYPNPDSETISFTLLNSGAEIDYIIVNTACVPEPATMLLLGVGGIVTLLRRKK